MSKDIGISQRNMKIYQTNLRLSKLSSLHALNVMRWNSIFFKCLLLAKGLRVIVNYTFDSLVFNQLKMYDMNTVYMKIQLLH